MTQALRHSRWRWLWLLAPVSAAGLILWATTLPRSPSFDFLHGRESVESQLSQKQWALVDKGDLLLRAYTFQADFSTLERVADTELAMKGFQKRKILGPRKARAGRAFYVRGSDAALGLAPPLAGATLLEDSQSLTIYADTRFSADFLVGPKPPGKDRGWVTIIVRSTPTPTFFDRFQEWVGL